MNVSQTFEQHILALRCCSIEMAFANTPCIRQYSSTASLKKWTITKNSIKQYHWLGPPFVKATRFRCMDGSPLPPETWVFSVLYTVSLAPVEKRGSSCSTTAEHKPHNAMSKKKLVKQHFSKNIKSRNRTNSPLKVNLQLDRLEHS